MSDIKFMQPSAKTEIAINVADLTLLEAGKVLLTLGSYLVTAAEADGDLAGTSIVFDGEIERPNAILYHTEWDELLSSSKDDFSDNTLVGRMHCISSQKGTRSEIEVSDMVAQMAREKITFANYARKQSTFLKNYLMNLDE